MNGRFARVSHALFATAVLSGLLAREAKADSAFVYVNANPNQTQNTVAALRVAGGVAFSVPGAPFATSGLGLSPAPGADFTHRVVIAPKRNLLFASNDGSGSIAVFTINRATGALTPVSGSPFSVGGWGAFSGISLAISGDGNYLYASSKTVISLAVAANGALSQIGASWGFFERVAGIAVDPENAHLFLSTASGVNVLRTGSAGLTADPPDILNVGSTATDLGLSSTGKHFWITTNSGGIQAYGYDSGSFSIVPLSPFLTGVSNLGGVTIDPSDRFLVAHSPTVPRVLWSLITPNWGLGSSSAAAISPVFQPWAAALSPQGGVYFAADSSGQLDAYSAASNGALTHLNGFPTLTGAAPGFPSVATLPAESPAPGAPGFMIWGLAALLLCVGAVGLQRRRVIGLRFSEPHHRYSESCASSAVTVTRPLCVAARRTTSPLRATSYSEKSDSKARND